MLLQRIITASILAGLLALAIFFMPITYFTILIATITLVAAWEWSGLVGTSTTLKRSLFLLVLLLPMLGIHFWTQFLELVASTFDWTDVRSYSGILEWLVVPPIIFWVLMMFIIRKTPTGILSVQVTTRYKLLIGWFVLFSTWMFLSRLRAFYGAEMTMYFMLLIWAGDVAAYFSGKKFGTIKLSPEISPGKTVQGMYGALAAGALCAVTLSLIYKFHIMVAADFVLLSVLTVLSRFTATSFLV